MSDEIQNRNLVRSDPEGRNNEASIKGAAGLNMDSDHSSGVILKTEKPVETSATKIQNIYNWTGYTILIVEDNYISFKLLEVLLRNSKVKIFHADNGQKAIDMVRLHPEINLVLMDLQLPVINGYEATLEIKKIRPSLPVIAQTANAMDDDQLRCSKLGCEGYITKPINFEIFFTMVDKFLRETT